MRFRVPVFASLKLAVFIILGLAASLATATVLESLYDTPTAQYFVYKALWFHGLLALLVVCLIAVMVDRWPWKTRHIPFLLAHVGIITLLFGSLITERFGLDGSLRITEGEIARAVDVNEPILVLQEGTTSRVVPIPWQPPGTRFSPISTSQLGMPYDIVVDQYLSHSEPEFAFVPNKSAPPPDPTATSQTPRLPAARVKLVGGAMRIKQDFWLWAGDPSFSELQAGPARLELKIAGGSQPWEKGDPATANPETARSGPKLTLIAEKEGGLSYRAESSDHQGVSGRLAADGISGKTIDPGWRGGVKIQLSEWIPDAMVVTTFKPSRVQYGDQAPPSAIHVSAGPAQDAQVWLGNGSRAMLRAKDHEVLISYSRKRVMLPFAVRLNHFKVDMYEGGQKPAAYSSNVTVPGGSGVIPGSKFLASDGNDLTTVISMNEPLQYRGITLYQSSYEDASPRPVTSIFSVNRDPGRALKYLGSLLIVLGSILLFAMKYQRKPRKA